MAISMIEVGIILMLLMAIVVYIVTVISSRTFGNTLAKRATTFGMNGTSGKKITLSCPAGQVIDFTNRNKGYITRGALISVTGGTDGTCDAFYKQGGQGTGTTFFNLPNIIDVFDPNTTFTDVSSCAGKQTCDFVVPMPTDDAIPNGSCLKNAKKLGFVGTYDCIQKL